MRLRAVLVLVSLVVLTCVVGAILFGITSVVDSSAIDDVDRDLRRAQRVVTESWAYRVELQREEVRRLAEDPRLRAVIATNDIDHATIVDVASDLSRAIDADIFVVLDADGNLLADVNAPDEQGLSLLHLPAVEATLNEEGAGGFWTMGELQYHVQGHQVSFGEVLTGAIITGTRIDDTLAAAFSEQTGALVLALHDQELFASHVPESYDVDPAAIAAGLPATPDSDSVYRFVVDQERYIAITHTADAADDVVRFALVLSLEQRLAPSRNLKSVTYLIGGLGALFALLAAFLLARRFAHSIAELATTASQIGTGDFAARAKESGVAETRSLAAAINQMAGKLEVSQNELAAKERLEREMEIAQHLQTSMLPRSIDAPELEVAACMYPASEVGGDYYDVLAQGDGGCWIGIGDVSGHGLPAGTVMMMLQTGVAAMVRTMSALSPTKLLVELNDLLFTNIRERLCAQQHVTFGILHHLGGGRFKFAGAHEDMLVLRKKTGTVERIPTPGPWLAVGPDVREHTVEGSFQLYVDDILVLITDGVFEAMNEAGELFGMERVVGALEEIENWSQKPALEIRDHLVHAVSAWEHERYDDVTVVVIRYQGP